MRRSRRLSGARLAIAGALLAFSSPAARSENAAGNAASTKVPAYNPYPPGILPRDLDEEIARVQREMRSIFNEGLNEWKQLPSPKMAGNPSTLEGSGYEAIEVLGKLMNFDLNMSPFRNEACAFLPHAVRRLQRTDPVRQSHDGRVSRYVSLSGRQADGAAIYVFA